MPHWPKKISFSTCLNIGFSESKFHIFQACQQFETPPLVIHQSLLCGKVPFFSVLEVSHYSRGSGNELITCWECACTPTAAPLAIVWTKKSQRWKVCSESIFVCNRRTSPCQCKPFVISILAKKIWILKIKQNKQLLMNVFILSCLRYCLQCSELQGECYNLFLPSSSRGVAMTNEEKATRNCVDISVWQRSSKTHSKAWTLVFIWLLLGGITVGIC